ncbi:DUF975 family protein [Mobilitalea sibirica]|uniref:DUF975 family protein n=2 Tax=Mobilitalea sibirica TaxID=1462919 RepID=A0A8J7H1R1_9FIRM|nr:DUF975 family protein [Mobilitalea sibirica]
MVLGGVSRGGSSNGRGDNSNSFVFQELSSSFWVFITVIISFILLWALITFFIGGAVELGYCRFNKNLIQGTNPQLKDLFSRFDIFFKALGLRIVIAIFTFLWGLLLIIPGIIAALSYSMAFYIMEENPSMGILDAIGESKEMMRGNKFRLFCLGLSFIGWLILCVFTFGIGMLWLVPYMNASFAAFYLEVSKSDETLA